MKFEFRTGLFGFQKNDVMAYIQRSMQEFSAKEQDLNRKITDLTETKADIQRENDALKNQLAQLQAEVDDFRAREEEIEKTSISIGTMYLVAKQNADEMIQTAEKYAADVNEYANRQLEVANKANEELEQLRFGVGESADRFSAELSVMAESLSESKARLESQMAALTPVSQTVSITDGSEL